MVLIWLDSEGAAIACFEVENTTKVEKTFDRFHALIGLYPQVKQEGRCFVIAHEDNVGRLEDKLTQSHWVGYPYFMERAVSFFTFDDFIKFYKNFPDDTGFPDFLFELTIILFKTNNLESAEKKAFETYCSNTYIFDKFFGRPIIPLDKYENSNIDVPAFTDHFNYSCKQPDLVDFTVWLDNFLQTEKFKQASKEYVEIYKRLKKENDYEARHCLVARARELELQF